MYLLCAGHWAKISDGQGGHDPAPMELSLITGDGCYQCGEQEVGMSSVRWMNG